MATVRFSVPVGGVESAITQAVGAATVTTNVELTVDTGNTMEGSTRVIQKDEVILALRRLIDYIMAGGKSYTGWPPQ